MDYSQKYNTDPTKPDQKEDLRPLDIGRCVTLTSVNDFNSPTSEARTPRSLGPELRYGDPGPKNSFLAISCDEASRPPSDHVRISGLRIFGTTDEQQYVDTVGIGILGCVDVEISNIEIHGFGGKGISIKNAKDPRITEYSEVRIRDSFIHHNQHPSSGDHANGYGVETHAGARAHIYRNVFDFNRHAIASGSDKGTGYFAEENLVLKGGGWHGRAFNHFTHIFDVHGDGHCWWDGDLCGNAGQEYHYHRNSFQYHDDKAIHIRGTSRTGAWFTQNVFPHDRTSYCCWWWAAIFDPFVDEAILLDTHENIDIEGNITKTDTYGKYYSQCDFDGDAIDDLFLATGATWWYSSSGKFHWTFLNTSSKQLKDLSFGYFDDDDRCDIITESGSGRWLISSGGTAPWKPLEQVWVPQVVEDAWKPLKDVRFGRFDPNDLSHGRQTTHAFYRNDKGEWRIKKLSEPTSDWEYVGGSHYPLSKLRFGDFGSSCAAEDRDELAPLQVAA